MNQTSYQAVFCQRITEKLSQTQPGQKIRFTYLTLDRYPSLQSECVIIATISLGETGSPIRVNFPAGSGPFLYLQLDSTTNSWITPNGELVFSFELEKN